MELILFIMFYADFHISYYITIFFYVESLKNQLKFLVIITVDDSLICFFIIFI